MAFGPSAPELAVSIGSSLSGQADLALGNVIVSNVFNLLAVLGLSAAAAPAGIRRRQLGGETVLRSPLLLSTSQPPSHA